MLEAGGPGAITRPVSPATAEFGSARAEFWEHAVVEMAWPDTLGAGYYLHVPCHVDYDGPQPKSLRPCPVCHDMGWEGTVHRLYPIWHVGDVLTVSIRKKKRHLRVEEILVRPAGKGWEWLLDISTIEGGDA